MTSWWDCKPSGRASGQPVAWGVNERRFSFNTYKATGKHTMYFIQASRDITGMYHMPESMEVTINEVAAYTG